MNYITPPLAIRAAYEVVLILIAGATWEQQDAIGFGAFSTSTKHILQFPATLSL
jgi:hypothetical protein